MASLAAATLLILATGPTPSPIALASEADSHAAQPFEGYAELPGAHLWYTDTGGSGVPVVLLHAATGSAEMWQYNTTGLARAGYRAIAYDRRGWGRTRIDPTTGEHPGTAADDLDALVAHLRLDPFHLVGTASGGTVAYEYALTRPVRLRSLVVVGTGGGGLGDPELEARRARAQLPNFREWPVQFRELGSAYMAADPEGVERWLEIIARSRQKGVRSQPPRAQLSVAGLRTIAVPTLVVAGGADLVNPPWVMRVQAELIPGAELLLMPEAGHSPNWEEPEAFNAALIEFFGRH